MRCTRISTLRRHGGQYWASSQFVLVCMDFAKVRSLDRSNYWIGGICVGKYIWFYSCVLYMVDTYMTVNAASALAANGLLRYIFGAVFPLFAVQMYNGMGF